MKYMFYNCTKLNNILNISNWDTKIVENISFMFAGYENFIKINFKFFETKNAMNMASMFCDCKLLKIYQIFLNEILKM